MTERQKQRVEREWTKIAGELVTVELINGTFYAYGSELACLRLFRAFHASQDACCDYSKNLQTWYFSKTNKYFHPPAE